MWTRKTPAHTIQSTYHGRWTVYHWTQSYANTAQSLGIQYGRPEQSSIRRHTKTRSSFVVSQANTSLDNPYCGHPQTYISSVSVSLFRIVQLMYANSATRWLPKYHPSLVSRHLTSPESFNSSTMKMNKSRRSSVIHSQAAFKLFHRVNSYTFRHYFNTILRRRPTALFVGKF